MSKFFLEGPKPKLLWQDHRVVTFKEFQKSLKKFKLFQIQKIIKKIKSKETEDAELESKLEYYKRIPSSVLTNLALYTINQMKIDINQIKQHLDKTLTGSVEDIISLVQGEIKQSGSQLSEFYKQFKAHPLYAQTKTLSTKTKKIQKKRNKTKLKQLKKKQQTKQVGQSKEKQHEKRNKSVQDVKIRYAKKPASNEKVARSKFVNKSQVKKEQVKPAMHPSWQAKLQQNKTAVFSGKKISLI